MLCEYGNFCTCWYEVRLGSSTLVSDPDGNDKSIYAVQCLVGGTGRTCTELETARDKRREA